MIENKESKLVLDEEEGKFIVQWRSKTLTGEDVYHKRDFTEFGDAAKLFQWKSLLALVEWAKLEDPVNDCVWEFKRSK